MKNFIINKPSQPTQTNKITSLTCNILLRLPHQPPQTIEQFTARRYENHRRQSNSAAYVHG